MIRPIDRMRRWWSGPEVPGSDVEDVAAQAPDRATALPADVAPGSLAADPHAKTVDLSNEKQDSDRLQQWLEQLDPDDMGKYKM